MIRPACASDIPSLLALMRELARFEGYLDQFAVTAESLRANGFPGPGGTPTFGAVVAAQAEGRLSGYAVYYLIPYTYTLRPTLVLKEIFVEEGGRSSGVGAALLQEVQGIAECCGCGQIKWAVLPENVRAKAFYRRWGGAPETRWEYWVREL